MAKFNHIRKVHFMEIPSVKFEKTDDTKMSMKNGLHLILTNKCQETHRMYIPDTFKVSIDKLLEKSMHFNTYDYTAYFVYQYLKGRTITDKQWKVLWYLLRCSNNLLLTIKKFFMLKNS